MSYDNFSNSSTIDPQALFDELFPLCRSLTGSGYDQSLNILRRYIPFEIENYYPNSEVFDWQVPPAWHLRRAVLKDPQGNIILDSDVNPMHVVNYSEPFSGTVTLEELQKHLYSDPNNPSAIPYVISYYNKRWGFCLSHEQRQQLTEGLYKVEIDTSKDNHGSIKVGVCDLPGQTNRIVQISSYLCHPNMMNNELSGPIGQVYLYLLLKSLPRRKFTYRFVINPETIGAVCYLSRHASELKERLEYGVVLTCIAAPYNTKAQNKPLTKATKAVNYTASYFDLVEAVSNSYQHNFLALPLSFKMTRQSMCDEFNAYLNSSHELPQLLVHKEELNASSLNTKELTALLQRASSAEMKNHNQPKSNCHFVCTELFNKKLSDKEKLKHYERCERAYDEQGCTNYHALNSIVPHGSQHLFKYTYDIDNALAHLAAASNERISLRRFSATSGSDERQYCSALMNLPMVQVTRTQYACYPDYHTSKDNQEIFSLDSIIDSALGIFRILQYLEQHYDKPEITVACEPQLGKRGLYPDINSPKVRAARNERINSLETLLSLLNLSDGNYNIDELAMAAQVSPLDLIELLEHLYHSNVLSKCRLP